MRRLVCFVVLPVLLGCPRGDDSVALLSQVKQGLADRDAKVKSYHLTGKASEKGEEADFDFDFRSPNRMRGTLRSPRMRMTYSFDGQKLYQLAPEGKKFVTFELKLPADKSELYLTQIFTPFAPEGFRTPLLLRKGVTARRVEHPQGPDAVEVRMETRDESGKALHITYLLRWPALDFLEKRLEVDGAVSRVRMEEEQCEPSARVCFPKKLTQSEGAEIINTTTLTNIQLNPNQPVEEFTLVAPPGFAAESHDLVEQGH